MPFTTPAPATRPVLPAPGVALALLGESVAHRAELAVLELDEAQDRALGFSLLAAAAAILALISGFAVTLLLASLVWEDPHRAWWLAGLCAADLTATAITGFIFIRRVRTWRPLGATRHQLNEDYQCLRDLFKSAAS